MKNVQVDLAAGDVGDRNAVTVDLIVQQPCGDESLHNHKDISLNLYLSAQELFARDLALRLLPIHDDVLILRIEKRLTDQDLG